jgi:hypothetical protein
LGVALSTIQLKALVSVLRTLQMYVIETKLSERTCTHTEILCIDWVWLPKPPLIGRISGKGLATSN